MARGPEDGDALERRLLKRVSNLLTELGLAHSRSPLVVAVSGGPDSLALLLLLDRLRLALGLSLHVAHLDHSLREDAQEDARFVEGVSRKLDLPLTVGKENVESYRASRGLSLEEAAREVRYSFLSSVATAEVAIGVALGHTADDQVETILMHLVRGSGLAGLAGMSPLGYWPSPVAEAKVALVRPLLEVTRDETEAYCRHRGVSPREDYTNRSMQFTRNRIRLDLIPKLREYNPRFSDALQRLGRSAAQDQEYFLDMAAIAKERLTQATEEGLETDRREFNALPAALKIQLLRLMYQEISGSMLGLESRHLEDMMTLSRGRAGTRLDLPQGLAFSVDYKFLRLGLAKGKASNSSILVGEHPLELPGEALLPGWIVQAHLTRGDEAFDEIGGYAARLDKDAVGSHLYVRGRQVGDRFHPLGMTKSKKLQDFLVDAKVPREMRDRIPLVVSERGIVWVVGHRIAHWARLTRDTQEVLELNFSPTSPT